MVKLKVTYFDFAGSRGEEVRLALTIAGQEFEDNRLPRETFGQLKPNFPFAAVPTLEVEGQGIFSQSNAILRLIGRLYGLYPDEPFEAARHDAFMDAVEDLRHRIAPTSRLQDPAEKTAARRQLAGDYIPQWGRCVERLLGEGPFVGGKQPGVADIKLYVVEKWISGGGVDDVPQDIFDHYVKLKTLVRECASLPAVVARYAKPL